MQNNFDLKKFLIENKLTPSSQNEGREPIMLGVGDQITPDMLKNPSEWTFPMEIVRFSNDGADDTVWIKRILKKKGMFGREKEIEDTFEDLVYNWEKYDLKPHVKMSPQTEIDFPSSQNEGFRDMFQKSKPSETFQGSSKEEFIKWATLVFNEKGIPKNDYDYFLGDVDSSYDWDESYKGVSQDELVNYHLKPWLIRNNFSADEYSLNEIMHPPYKGGVNQDREDAARRAAEKEKKRKADLGDEEYARVKGEETLSFSITQAKRAAKALGKDISKEIEAIKTKHSGNTTKQKEAVKRLYSKLNKERINKK